MDGFGSAGARELCHPWEGGQLSHTDSLYICVFPHRILTRIEQAYNADCIFRYLFLSSAYNSFIARAFILLIAFHIPASSKSTIKPVLVTISGL